MASKRYKLPADPRRRKQVKTFMSKHGREQYRKSGSKGGHLSPTKFDSERGRAAALKMHEIRRQKQAAKAAREE